MKIQSFKDDWKEIRGKTYEFLQSLPDRRISWSPHKDLGTFGMQIRHMGVSQRAYINGMKSGKVDFEDKSYDKRVELTKADAIAFLEEADNELMKVLETADEDSEIDFHDGVYGAMKVTLGTILEWMIQHETYHQGIFTCYGRIAGHGKFRFM